MSNTYVYPFIAHQDTNKGITRLDQSADRIAASLAGNAAFNAAPHHLIAAWAYDLAEAVIAKGDKREKENL